MSKLLTLIVDNEAAQESKTNVERTWNKVEQMLINVADRVDSRGQRGLVKTQNFFELTDDEVEELRAMLRKQAVLLGTVESDGEGGLKIDIDSKSQQAAIEKFGRGSSVQFDIFVQVSKIKKDGRWQIDVGRLDAMDNVWRSSVVYLFSENDLRGSNPFRGRRFYEIQEMLTAKHGADTEVLRRVNRVVELCRAVLYEGLGKTAEQAALNELKALKLSVGQAANAIIQDFDRDLDENEGW